MKTSLRLTILGGMAIGLGVLTWALSKENLKNQAFSLSPVLDRAVEAKSAVHEMGQHVIRLSDTEEMRAGGILLDQWYAPMEKDEYLQKVLDRLVKKGGVRRPGISYRVQIIQDGCVNAFAMPGGYLFVTSGMMDFLKNEAELAMILGHEMAHVELYHCSDRISAEVRAKKAGLPLLEGVAALGNQIMTQGYQDEQEHEADRWGMQLAAESGYDPSAATQLFQRLLAHSGGERPAPKRIREEVRATLLEGLEDLFASHPATSKRIQSLERAQAECGLPEPGKYYEQGVRNFQERECLS